MGLRKGRVFESPSSSLLKVGTIGSAGSAGWLEFPLVLLYAAAQAANSGLRDHQCEPFLRLTSVSHSGYPRQFRLASWWSLRPSRWSAKPPPSTSRSKVQKSGLLLPCSPARRLESSLWGIPGRPSRPAWFGRTELGPTSGPLWGWHSWTPSQ